MGLNKYLLDQLQGINRKNDRVTLPQTWYYDLMNAFLQIETTLNIKMRDGLTKLTASGSAQFYIDGLFYSEFSTGVNRIFATDYDDSATIVMPNGHLYYHDSTANKFVLISGASVPMAAQLHMTNDKVACGQSLIDSSFNVTTGTAPNPATGGKVGNSRSYFAQGSILYCSGVGSTSYTTNNDSLTIDLSGVCDCPPYIIAVETYGEYVICIGVNRIVVYYIPSIFENIRLIAVIKKGVTGKNGWCIANKQLFLACWDGLFSLDLTNFTVQDKPLIDLDYWNSLILTIPKNVYNLTSFVCPAFMSMIYDVKNELILIAFNKSTFSTSTNKITWTTNEVLVFSLLTGQWVSRYLLFEGQNYPVQFCRDNNNIIYVSANKDLYKFDSTVYLDGTVPISFDFIPGYIGQDSIFNNKTPKVLDMVVKEEGLSTDTLTLKYNTRPVIDQGLAASTQTTTTIPLVTGTQIVQHTNFNDRGKLIELEFSKSSASRITLSNIQLTCELEGEV